MYQLKEYEPTSRHGTLVALLIETSATLTDEILDLHDRLIGSFFTKSKNKYERAFAEQGRAINDKVRLYARVGAALVAARDAGRDAFKAIEDVLSWEVFSESVKEAEKLAREEEFDPLELLTNHYSVFRRYSPILLETFEFKAAAFPKSQGNQKTGGGGASAPSNWDRQSSKQPSVNLRGPPEYVALSAREPCSRRS